MEENFGMKILTIANNKGGVGKTTTTVNLAEAFGRMDYRVLVIDLDPQGNASLVIGDRHPSQVPCTAAELLLRNDVAVISEAIQLNTRMDNVSLIYGDIERMSSIEDDIRQKSLQPAQLLSLKLRALKGAFDIILIDTPPALGMLTANALAASTDYIVPLLSGDQFGLYGMTNLDKLVTRIKDINPGLTLAGALLVQYDNRQSICKVTANTTRERFPRVFTTTTSRATAVQQSVAVKMSVIALDPNNKVAREYRALAKEILAQWGVQPEAKSGEQQGSSVEIAS